MSVKHKTSAGFTADRTKDCETALVVLLQAFATLSPTVRLVGGLVPRYLTPAAPPHVPMHVGTTDVDVVLNVTVLAATGTYDKLKRQLKDAGFERYRPIPEGPVSSWQWLYRINSHSVLVEFLQHTDDPAQAARLGEIDGEDVSACRILHAGIAHDWYQEIQVTVDLPDGDGIVKETVRFADAVSFIVLKALAFNQRHEHKDAADLIHVMRYSGTPEAIAQLFIDRLRSGMHTTALEQALRALAANFCDEPGIEGYRKDGPAKFTNFHGLEGDVRIREQRDVHGLIAYFLSRIEQEMKRSYRAF